MWGECGILILMDKINTKSKKGNFNMFRKKSEPIERCKALQEMISEKIEEEKARADEAEAKAAKAAAEAVINSAKYFFTKGNSEKDITEFLSENLNIALEEARKIFETQIEGKDESKHHV